VSDYHHPAVALSFIRGSDRLLRGLCYWYNMGAELVSQERNADISLLFCGGLELIVEKFPN
jgi:hypothetical protein